MACAACLSDAPHSGGDRNRLIHSLEVAGDVLVLDLPGHLHLDWTNTDPIEIVRPAFIDTDVTGSELPVEARHAPVDYE
jgi:hypothetical protein